MTRNLSVAADLAEAAPQSLRLAAQLGGRCRIAVMELPAIRLGEALADRLRRAAETPPDDAP
ncbi:MAG: hypothetical protein R3D25_05530 [Geminicoccaceae bacterium]